MKNIPNFGLDSDEDDLFSSKGKGSATTSNREQKSSTDDTKQKLNVKDIPIKSPIIPTPGSKTTSTRKENESNDSAQTASPAKATQESTADKSVLDMQKVILELRDSMQKKFFTSFYSRIEQN